MLSAARAINPDTLCVMGGSNISHDPQAQSLFLAGRPMIDAYVYLEGEIGFSNLVDRALEENDLAIARITNRPVDGCLLIDERGQFVRGQPSIRKKELREFPSPYLTGLLDKFFGGLLSPMVETNRGCPFSCTFCHEGHQAYAKVNLFPLERVIEELRYIAERIPDNVHNLMFSDPNFGMYKRDLQICESIAHLQKETGWPRNIFASTGKNNKNRIALALKQLNGSMQMWLSIQSMDTEVLENIKRENIRLDAMIEIQSSLTAHHLPSKAEIILGLPGETTTSHLRGIADLMTAGVDTITPYTLMLLNGTELNTPESRSRWDLQTRFRVLPRDFGQLASGRRVIEAEEVVIGTRDLSFDDYLKMRRFHFLISVVYNGKPCASLFKLFRELELDIFPLLDDMASTIDDAPAAVRSLVDRFTRQTQAELWEREDELREFFRRPENYEKLVNGELGAHLIQKYTSLSLTTASEDWVSFVFTVADDLLAGTASDIDLAATLDELRRYCRARVRNLMGTDRLENTPEERLGCDYESWAQAPGERRLAEFQFSKPTVVRFPFSADQYRLMESYLDRFGRTTRESERR